jgi:hypothetical protein
VLPRVATAAIAADVRAVTTANVGVAIEIVISVDVNVAAAPTAAPAPAATPGRTHRQAYAERDRARRNDAASRIRWVINGGVRINRRAINNGGVV